MPKQHPNSLPPAELRPKPAPAAWPRPALVTPDTPLNECPTSLDLSTPRGKALMIAAMNPADVDFDDKGEARILATDWLVMPEVITDPETGEVKDGVRTVFFDREGRTFRTTSAHAPHNLSRALALYPPSEWRNGVPFVFRERKSRKTGRTYHDFRVELPDEKGEGR